MCLPISLQDAGGYVVAGAGQLFLFAINFQPLIEMYWKGRLNDLIVTPSFLRRDIAYQNVAVSYTPSPSPRD